MQINLFIIILLILSCSNYKISNFDQYTETLIPNSILIPNKEELNDTRRDIVIGNFESYADNSVNQFAKSAFKFKIEEKLSKYNHINILNRSIGKNPELIEEVQLLENKGKLKYSGPKDGEYIILGSIATLTIDSKLNSRSMGNAALKGLGIIGGILLRSDALVAGSAVSTPLSSKYEYKAHISGFIRILDLQTLTEIAKIPFEETAEDEEDASTTGLIQSLKNVKEENNGIILSAINKALNNKEGEILKALPLKGYILKRKNRVEEDKTIFLTNIGNGLGLKENDKIKIILKRKTLNQITNEEEITEEEINGFVSDKITNKNSWIIIENKTDAEKIQIGDLVKLVI